MYILYFVHALLFDFLEIKVFVFVLMYTKNKIGPRGRGRPRRTRIDDLRRWFRNEDWLDIMRPDKESSGKRHLQGTFRTHSSRRNNE